VVTRDISSVASELVQLENLKEAGILSEADFAAAKQNVMQGTPGGTPAQAQAPVLQAQVQAQVQAPVPQAMDIDTSAPMQFSLADGRTLYVEARTLQEKRLPHFFGPKDVFAEAPRTPLSTDVCCPMKGSNTSYERRTWYTDGDGVLTLRDGRQMYADEKRWVKVAEPGMLTNTDPARRIPASAIGADGVFNLPNGLQLYVNKSKGQASTEKEGTHTNKDPARRTWTLSRSPPIERSQAEVVAREVAYYLGLVFLGIPVYCACAMFSGEGDSGGPGSVGEAGYSPYGSEPTSAHNVNE
jgi:hypothetical protein